MSDLAERIVDALLKDLRRRKGLGDEWYAIDDEIQDEIRQTWIEEVRAALRASGQTDPDDTFAPGAPPGRIRDRASGQEDKPQRQCEEEPEGSGPFGF